MKSDWLEMRLRYLFYAHRTSYNAQTYINSYASTYCGKVLDNDEQPDEHFEYNFQGPILLTWINCNPSMDKYSHAH